MSNPLEQLFPDPEGLAPADSGLPLLEHQAEMKATIDGFEEKAWSPTNKGLTTGWKDFDLAIEGLQPGLHVLGADSNMGKSGWLSQMSWQVATLNGDRAYVLEISLDDPLADKLARVVGSSQRCLINAVRKPNSYQHLPKMLERRAEGIRKLREWVDCYKAVDGTMVTPQGHISNVDAIEWMIQKHLVGLQEEANRSGRPPRQLVVTIDNFHDLEVTDRGARDDKSRYEILADRIGDMATEYSVVIYCTAEFKKLNGNRRPMLDDLRESVKLKYKSKQIGLGYNEVGLKGEAAGVYFEVAGDPNRRPVFEYHLSKNKFAQTKGRLYFEFYPEMALYVPATEDAAKRYSNVIYSNE